MTRTRSLGASPLSSTSAFTLIELLVVIAIICLLAAILFPVFGRARENARKTSCMSNMKQLALGFIQYSQDFDERMPLGSQPFATNYRMGIGWGGQIYPYVKSSQIYKCPSDSFVPTSAARVTVSYGFNLGMGEDDLSATFGAGGGVANMTHQSVLNAPGKTVMLFEITGSEANVSAPGEGNTGIYTCTAVGSTNIFCLGGFAQNNNGAGKYAMGYMGGRTYTSSTTCDWVGGFETGCHASATGRHLEGSNYAMADGHAKWFKDAQVSNGSSAALSTDPQKSITVHGPAAGTEYPGFAVTFSLK